MVVSVDRIAGVVRARPVQPGTREGQFLPAPGESLLLTCEETAGEDLIATTPGGLSLRLAGLGKLGRQLRAGDTVLVRVVANEPVLELEVEGEALPPDDTVQVRSGHLEGSNVSAIEEMIATMNLTREFEVQMKLYSAADSMAEAGNRLLRE